MIKIEIYTSKSCAYCHKAKKLLKLLNLKFIEHDVSDSFDEMKKIILDKFQTEVSTIPQIIINDNYVGGHDNLEALYKSGKLDEILK